MAYSSTSLEFKPNKAGYKKYLKSKGFNYDGFNTPMFAISFEEFKLEYRDDISILEDRLEKLNDNFKYLTYTLGQDENDKNTDAYHLNINIRKIVYKLDKLYNI